jgi:hypothetical protein
MSSLTRERALDMAKAARKWPDPRQRRWAIMGLFKALVSASEGFGPPAVLDYTFRPRKAFSKNMGIPHLPRLPSGPVLVAPPQHPVVTGEDLFREGYGDPDGNEYWTLWLINAADDREIARALAGPLALELMPTIPDEASRISLLGVKDKAIREALARIKGADYRERIEKLCANPETAILVPTSLREFLAKGKEEPAAEQAPQAVPDAKAAARSKAAEAPLRNVSVAEIGAYLKGVATKQHMKPELRKLAQDRFHSRVVRWRVFEQAYKNLPNEQKRVAGQRKTR